MYVRDVNLNPQPTGTPFLINTNQRSCYFCAQDAWCVMPTLNVSFANPTLSYTSPASFGVISTQIVPGTRLSSSRWIQPGLRVSF